MVYTIEGVKAVPTYHPAALLRDPRFKRPVWDDIRLIRKEHDMAVEADGS
jgi:DNA polymerase